MTAPALPELSTHTLTAEDGATLGYRRIGHGPGLVVLHGAMSTGAHHRDLARELAEDFTVYLPDRRGRGLSGPRRPLDGLQRDVADLGLVLRDTGAHDVFAVSSGAIVALTLATGQASGQATGQSGDEDGVSRLIVNEPPMIAAGRARALLARLDAQLARGDLAAALVTGMKGAQLGPGFLNAVPDRLLAKLVSFGLNRPMVKGGGYPTMAELAPTLAADFRVVTDASDGGLDRFAGLRLPLTCLTGTKSPGYLHDGMIRLSTLVVGARLIELPDVGHEVSWNRDLRGAPGLIAEQIRQALR